ncbi:MAG: glycosyltransferase [Cyclobacteriaceae bacterium]|nr:glycosyltransferase [Cyclobacteriaceae bacterium]
MIEWGFIILIISYCLFIVYLWMGWERIPVSQDEDYKPSVAVIIPVRNEEANIQLLLEELNAQTYRGELEILIIDDHSEDGTRDLVEEYITGKPSFKLISLQDAFGKKNGLTKGVISTKADIILTMDGDCQAPKTWVEVMVQSFQKKIQFISGPVAFMNEQVLFNQMQSIEFASLIGSGAALIGWGKPLMANGANMGFRKSAFDAVNGFEGNQETASGDDVFLLHKIAKKFPESIAFVKQEGALIKTKSQPTINSFVHQRIRWASKWKVYTDLFTKTTAVFVFALSLSIIIFPFLVKFDSSALFLWANLVVMKAFFDFFFIRQIARFMDEKIELIPFMALQILYPFYVVLTALFSFRKSYVWKGRNVS